MGQSYELNHTPYEYSSEIELDKIKIKQIDSASDQSPQENEKFINSVNVEAQEQKKTPIDVKKIVYIIFIIHGIGTLMPWNMFMTAKSYYVGYKLNQNLTDHKDDEMLKNLQKNFMSSLGTFSQTPNLMFNGLNLFLFYYFGLGLDLVKFISTTICFNFFVMVFTIILVFLDTSSWPILFYKLTIFSVILLNISNGIYQNSIYGAAAKLPQNYMNAVVIGNNICGTVVSLISIASIAIAPSEKLAAFFYFFSAILILVACFCSFSYLGSNKFYKFYSQIQSSSKQSERPSYLYIIKHCGLQCLNVFLTFFVTLLLFPAVLSDIKRNDKDFFLSDKYFTEVFCFLNFNLFALIGNVITSVKFPSKYLIIPVFARILFIPFFYYCNFKKNTSNVIFLNEWYFIFGTMLMGLSHGYLSSLGMMYSVQSVKDEHKPIAGMLSAFCLICGIFSGIMTSFVF